MKIVAVAGSPNGLSGFSGKMLEIMNTHFKKNNATLEVFTLAHLNVGTCTGCFCCVTKGNCPLNDDNATIKAAMLKADGIIWLSPNYSFNVTAELKAFIDRNFTMMHRQMLKGKYALPFVTSGSWVLEEPLKYLYHILQRNGCWIVDSLGISIAEWKTVPKEKEKQLEAAATAMLQAIVGHKTFPEQEGQLNDYFETWKSYIQYFKDQHIDEYRYWVEHWNIEEKS